MSDYVSRQYLLNEYDRQHQGPPGGARKIIEGAPAADVVQVVHGRWVKYTGMGKEQWMCSECSAEEKNPKIARYCYYCGAKMDKG